MASSGKIQISRYKQINMVDINTIELSFKRIPEYNAELAKTVPSNIKTNYLVGSVVAIGIGLFTLFATSQSMLKILGGGLAVGGVGTSIYILQRKTDDSSEAQEERKSLILLKVSVRRRQMLQMNGLG